MLTCERIQRLTDLSFVWDTRTFVWKMNARRLADYVTKHGDSAVPHNYTCADGFALGTWVTAQRAARAKGKLAKERVTELDKLGFVWDAKQLAWDSALGKLKAYKAEYSDMLVSSKYTCADGFRLGKWVNQQRVARAKGKLAKERVTELDKLGFVWDAQQLAWDSALGRLKAYKAEYSDTLVPRNYTFADGFRLGRWVYNQRRARAKGKLAKERIVELDKLEIIDTAKEASDKVHFGADVTVVPWTSGGPRWAMGG
eukprot:Skav213721  [mRNA]  locus=scaffold2678:298068:299121:- [translate_table: standard]